MRGPDLGPASSPQSTSKGPKVLSLTLKTPNLPKLMVTINGYITEALVDTGATISVINAQFYHDNLKLPLNHCNTQILAASGEKCNLLGTIDCEVQIGQHKFPHTFYILVDLPEQCLIGIDFVRRYKLNLSFETETLCVPDSLPPVDTCIMPDIDLSKALLTTEQKDKLLQVLHARPGLFSSVPGFTQIVTHEIRTGDAKPITAKPYPLSPAHKIEMKKQIETMLQQGIIIESNSSWASPAFLVPKKDGGYRMVVDFRALNAVSLPQSYPLPIIQDILKDLSDTTYISTLDLTSGYYQMALNPNSIDKASFVTPFGAYSFQRMAFGLSAAPSSFQRLMDKVLASVLGPNVHVYLDDIIITSKTFSEHVQLLDQVLDLLHKAGLTLKISKCEFARKELVYLGLKITPQGLFTDNAKIQAITEFPSPTTAKELSRFLGMCSWYQQFIPHYATRCEKLYELRRKYKRFQWSPEAEAAFQDLKTAMISPPVLVFPDFSKPYQLYTDASKVGLGAVLSQDNHPIAYASRTLSPVERNYSATELECLAILFGLQKFRTYFTEIPIEVCTDHAALTHLSTAKNLSSRVMRWVLKLQEFNIVINYRSGKENQLPDALSRKPIEKYEETNDDIIALYLLSEITSKEQIKTELQADPDFGEIYAYLTKARTFTPSEREILNNKCKNYELIDGLLFYTKNCNDRGEFRPAIPRSLRIALLEEMHDRPISGHLGIRKTLRKLNNVAYWPKMYCSTRMFVQSCDVCQRVKYLNAKPAGYMISSNYSNVFEVVGMDLMGPYPLSIMTRSRYILVITDYFSKWIELFPLKNATAECITQCLIDNIITRYGAPHSIVSDNGSQFISEIFEQMCDKLQIKHVLTTPYHPQSNMTERVNRNLTRMISSYVGECHASWDRYLQQFAFALRSAVNDTTQTTPAELFLGRKILTPFERLTSLCDSESQRPSPEKLRKIAETARQAIQKAQASQKKYYDLRRREADIQVNDYILIETHFQSSFANVLVKKFAPLFEGPYKVVRVSENNIKAIKASGEEVKCHVSQCRKYCFRNLDKIISPIDYDEGPEITFQPPPPPFSHHSNRLQPTLSSKSSSSPAILPRSHQSSSTESAYSPIDRNNTPCHSPQTNPQNVTRESADTRSSIAEPDKQHKRKRRTNVHPPGYRHWDLRSGQKSPIPSLSTHYPKRQATNLQRHSRSLKREKPASVHSEPHKKPKWHPVATRTLPSVPADIPPAVPSAANDICESVPPTVPLDITPLVPLTSNVGETSIPPVSPKIVSTVQRYEIPARRAAASISYVCPSTPERRSSIPNWKCASPPLQKSALISFPTRAAASAGTSALTSFQTRDAVSAEKRSSTSFQTRATVPVWRSESTRYWRRPTTETRPQLSCRMTDTNPMKTLRPSRTYPLCEAY